MTSNFDERNPFNSPLDSGLNTLGEPQSPPSRLDNLKRDRFELLSAYLDGEVTAAERRQVETWLAEDATTQKLYSRLLKLRQGLRSLPVPATAQTADVVAQQVVSRLERKNHKRSLIWTGTAIAALVVSAIMGTLPRLNYAPQMAQSQEDGVPAEGLMIALDRPVIEIPKAPVSPGQPIYDTSNIQ